MFLVRSYFLDLPNRLWSLINIKAGYISVGVGLDFVCGYEQKIIKKLQKADY